MNVMVLVSLDKREGMCSIAILLKMLKKTCTRDFERNIPFSFCIKIPVCLLQILFLFLEYRRFLDTVSNFAKSLYRFKKDIRQGGFVSKGKMIFLSVKISSVSCKESRILIDVNFNKTEEGILGKYVKIIIYIYSLFLDRGTEELVGQMGRVDIINSTLGKALGGAAGMTDYPYIKCI